MTSQAYEVNFDGIVGPTHNYSGLSYGNVASMEHENTESNPKAAALQGLEKMKFLHDMGFKQAVLPPHERPHLPTLKALGFTGTDADILSQAAHKDPAILAACSSAASMWVANAATVCPSIDSIEKHVQITPANLSSKFHRSIEHEFTTKVLKAIFKDPIYFKHHPALLPGNFFSDEGAANHTRFCDEYGNIGVHLFVFGRYGLSDNPIAPSRFPARQTFEASQTISRLHQIYPERIILAQQNPRAIDAGVFHNDVIAVGNRNVFLYHEAAFVGKDQVIEEIGQKVKGICDTEMHFIEVPEKIVSLSDAVSSYFFNSQLLSTPSGSMTLIAPAECQDNSAIQDALHRILSDRDNPVNQVHYLNVRESMLNGGGPACLRLRVTLTEHELAAVHKDVFFTNGLYKKLSLWIHKHYRDKLLPEDLASPALLNEVYEALNELTKILNLGSLYSFQK